MATSTVRAGSTARGQGFLERRFELARWGTNARTEFRSGLTTFLVMSYILVVNPAILSSVQNEASFLEIATGTAIVAGVMTIAMGWYTNRALAIAPGMGLNAVVAFTLMAQEGLTFGEAMGVIVAEGLLITVLVFAGLREYVLNTIPAGLRYSISMGIGLFILIIGANDAGWISAGAGTPISVNNNAGWTAVVAMIGLVITGFLWLRNVRGDLLIGIIATTVVAIMVNAWFGNDLWPSGTAVVPDKIVQSPDTGSLFLVSFGFFSHLGVWVAIVTILAIMMSDFFDTAGTLTGVGQQAGYLDDDGNFVDAEKPLRVDSIAALFGGLAGTSSATTYVESSAGVAEGGRTGLTAVTTGILFLLAIPLLPLVAVVPVQATAPALIIVGVLMVAGSVRKIDWDRREDAFAAIATMIFMPLTFTITYGIAAGFLAHTLGAFSVGRYRMLKPAFLVVTVLFGVFIFREYLFGVSA